MMYIYPPQGPSNSSMPSIEQMRAALSFMEDLQNRQQRSNYRGRHRGRGGGQQQQQPPKKEEKKKSFWDYFTTPQAAVLVAVTAPFWSLLLSEAFLWRLSHFKEVLIQVLK